MSALFLLQHVWFMLYLTCKTQMALQMSVSYAPCQVGGAIISSRSNVTKILDWDLHPYVPGL